jgi:microcin C transport system substrate-binding protein
MIIQAKRVTYFAALLASLTLFTGCFGSSSSNQGSSGGDEAVTAKVVDPEGDASVSAEDGGPGFTGEGWTTVEPAPLGDPKAVKGGTMLTSMPNWPENLRVYGTGSNTFLNSIMQELCYEALLELDPNTQKFVPSLASHWKVSEDQMTFTYRIDPRAHWSDGKPVTSDDVIATYRLIADETLVDPASREAIVAKMEEPVAKSKYIFEVKCKEKNWRNFISMGGMAILPSHEIKDLKGSDYLDKYNFKYTAGSGPYIVHQADIKENESLTLTRRKDYWGASLPRNEGVNNIDKIRFQVIRDQRLSFDKACKGELDFAVVYTAKWWVEDIPGLEAVENGHLVPQKIYTKYPQGIQGLAFNMHKPPLDDIRVRKAIAHLYDRKTMLEKFAYNQYDPLKSYYPGGDAENPDNKTVGYDPRAAAKLLEEAGWSKRGTDGILEKDGKRLSFTLTYRTPGLEKYFTTLKEDAKKAGVEFKLSLTTPETQWKNTQERNFEIVSQAWGAILFPSPESSWHSKMADAEGSTNITGFANPEVDKIIEKYNAEFDLEKRTAMLRDIDAIVFNEHPYALAWYLPCERLLYWNKFGTPETVLPKYSDWRTVFAVWWVDPSKEKALKAARKSGAKLLPIPPKELRPWDGDTGKTAALN